MGTRSAQSLPREYIPPPAIVSGMPPFPMAFLDTTVRKSGSPGREPADTPEAIDSDGDAVIRCRDCLFPITRPANRIAIRGRRTHTFANPAGLVYTIGAFSAAGGCGTWGVPSEDFTWFPGYRWQVAFCRQCRAHLGWMFLSGTGAFWGLILNHLLFPSEAG
ncbi:MAG: cereblon family protein [Desulfobacterales bacterium]|jgi:hypothetical protein